MDLSKYLIFAIIVGCSIVNSRGCQYCGCYGYPNCDCYCPPWMITGDDHIVIDQARGQVSVSSSAAASVKYNKGAPQAYISSLSSAKADPKIPVNIVGNGSAQGSVSPEPYLTTPPPTGQPTTPAVVTTHAPVSKNTWAYKASETAYGPANWGAFAPGCNGQHQSPIAIATTTAETKPLASSIALTIANPDAAIKASKIVKGKFINNGKALGFNVDHTQSKVQLNGSILGAETFTLRQFHFHIGCEGEMGSEHALDGQRYPGELHFIFTNDKYPNAKIAMQQSDGLAAVAFFIQYDHAAQNPAFKRISDNIQNLRMPHGSLKIPDGISLTNMVPALKEGLVNLRRFAYKGSLPTPPCFESVTWIVFRRPISVHPEILENMRNHLQGDRDRMCNNFRPIQPVNDRKVFSFVPDAQAQPVAPAAPPVAADDGTEVGGIAPGIKSMPLARLIGSPSKVLNDQSSLADARHELQAGSGPQVDERKDKPFVQQVTADEVPSSAFTKNPASKESKLIPEGKAKQELKKEVEKVTGFAGDPKEQLKSNDLRKDKPTVAPGMKRQHL